MCSNRHTEAMKGEDPTTDLRWFLRVAKQRRRAHMRAPQGTAHTYTRREGECVVQTDRQTDRKDLLSENVPQ